MRLNLPLLGLLVTLTACAGPTDEPATAASNDTAATAPADSDSAAPAAEGSAASDADSDTGDPRATDPAGILPESHADGSDERSPVAEAGLSDVEVEGPPDRLPEPTDIPDPDPLRAGPETPEIGAAHAAALAEAQVLRAEAKQSDAIKVLRAAEKEYGDHPMLRLEAAWCFMELAQEAFRNNEDKFLIRGNIADAHLRHDQAVKMGGELPTSNALLARIYRYEEDPDRARELLLDHFTRYPDDILAHREMADMGYVSRNWEQADTHYTRVAELDPTDGEARQRATFSKQWVGSYPAADLERGYRMAAKLLPEDNDPIRLLVGLYPRSTAEQLRVLDEIIADNESAILARVWKSYVVRTAREPDIERALAILDEALEVSPDHPMVIFNQGETLLIAERMQAATEAFVRAMELGVPGQMYSMSMTLDAFLHLDERSLDLPRKWRDRAYDAMVAANPNEGAFGNNAGLWYRDVGKDYEKSLKYYQAAVDAQPNDQDYLNDCALIYLFHLRDQKELSLPMFEKVVGLVEDEGQDPMRGYWDALENLCKYHFEVGQYETVLDYAERRADPSATVNGRPYPSMKAADWAAKSRRKLKGD